MIPLRCVTCQNLVDVESFECHLSENQKMSYLSYVAATEHEKLEYCCSCPYFEIHVKDNMGKDFMYCQNPKCMKISCVHCHAECKIPEEEGGFDDDEMEVDTFDKNDFRAHMICADFATDKELLEAAIEKGHGQECPGCGVVGRKDENCTHIVSNGGIFPLYNYPYRLTFLCLETCLHCSIEFCYVCGVATADLDKDTAGDEISFHNVNWETNPKRCPMYLTQIGAIDNRWPDEDKDDDECVDLFGKFHTLQLLRETIANMGLPRYHELCEKYGSVQNIGLAEEDILYGDLEMIHRITEEELVAMTKAAGEESDAEEEEEVSCVYSCRFVLLLFI